MEQGAANFENLLILAVLVGGEAQITKYGFINVKFDKTRGRAKFYINPLNESLCVAKTLKSQPERI